MRQQYRTTKHKIYVLLHPEIGESKLDKFINIFIISLIILNVAAVMLETVDILHKEYRELFDRFDQVSVYIFTIEYLLRLWSCTEDPKYRHSIKGRIKYMFSWGAIIDLLAFLPHYLHIFSGFDLRTLRILRLIRFFRLFRLTAYTRSAQMIFNVFKSRINELTLSFVLAIFLIIIASCVIYFAEHLHPENKEKFSSIPATIWWAVVTLTTTGYGDMYPMTAIGKTLTGIIMLTGVAFFALPAGIITAGFIDEFKTIKKNKGKTCPNCGHPLDAITGHHTHQEEE